LAVFHACPSPPTAKQALAGVKGLLGRATCFSTPSGPGYSLAARYRSKDEGTSGTLGICKSIDSTFVSLSKNRIVGPATARPALRFAHDGVVQTEHRRAKTHRRTVRVIAFQHALLRGQAPFHHANAESVLLGGQAVHGFANDCALQGHVEGAEVTNPRT